MKSSALPKPRQFGNLPALNEPVSLRYSRRALFENDAEELTFSTYKLYRPKDTVAQWENPCIFRARKLKNYKEDNIRISRGLPFMPTRASLIN